MKRSFTTKIVTVGVLAVAGLATLPPSTTAGAAPAMRDPGSAPPTKLGPIIQPQPPPPPPPPPSATGALLFGTGVSDITGPAAEVVMMGYANSDQIMVRVADTGHGVPPQNRTAIFDPFFTTRSPQEGTGLGLYVSLQILHGLGGRLTLLPTDSSDTPGATFLITLPRLAEATPATVAP